MRSSLIAFIFLQILVTIYLLATTGQLPDIVASHFDGSGAPNGFMSQKGYLIFMLVFSIGVPCCVMYAIGFSISRAPSTINIPNKDYWLADERREATLRQLKNQLGWLASLITLFMGYIHWVILQANAIQPAHLLNEEIFSGVVIFVLAVLAWAASLVLHFLRTPN